MRWAELNMSIHLTFSVKYSPLLNNHPRSIPELYKSYPCCQGYEGMLSGGDFIKELTWQAVSGIINKVEHCHRTCAFPVKFF